MQRTLSSEGSPEESKIGLLGAGDVVAAPEGGKVKRTRIRKPASCTTCRTKKLRCDRLLPCEGCRTRGEQDQCSYGEGSAPLHVARTDDDSAALRAQVDRLQALVNNLANTASVLSSASVHQPKISPTNTMTNSEVASPGIEHGDLRKLNLKSLDLCEALGQLTVSGVVRLDAGQPHNVPLMAEARAALANSASPSEGLNLGTFPFSSAPDSIEKIMAILPSLSQAETVITCFRKQLSWYIYFFPWTTFNQQWKQLQNSTTANVDCSFLGVFLAVCGTGLYFLPDKLAVEFPQGPERIQMAKSLFDASASALTLARFLACPSLNTIHAMQLLTAWHIYLSPGDTSSTGFAILNIAAEAVLQLGLHREPDETSYTPFECNVRRLTFWNTVMLETQAGSSLGKTWSMFQLKRADARLPLSGSEASFLPDGYLIPDYQEAEEPDMVSILLRMRVAILSKTISDRAFSIEDVSFSTVLELDRELHQLEDSFPPHYKLDFKKDVLVLVPGLSRLARLRVLMVNIGLLQEYLRLHRPFVASGSSYGVCRTTCLKAARMMIAIYSELAVFNYGGLTFKAITACCVICMDLITNPTSSDAAAMRQDVLNTIALLEMNKYRSKLASNGVSLLQFLHNKSSPPSNLTTSNSPSLPVAEQVKRHRADSRVGRTKGVLTNDVVGPLQDGPAANRQRISGRADEINGPQMSSRPTLHAGLVAASPLLGSQVPQYASSGSTSSPSQSTFSFSAAPYTSPGTSIHPTTTTTSAPPAKPWLYEQSVAELPVQHGSFPGYSYGPASRASTLGPSMIPALDWAQSTYAGYGDHLTAFAGGQTNAQWQGVPSPELWQQQP